MSTAIVITFTGPDRPGIVDRISGIVAEHGANWEESRNASLAGRFAGILKVTVPEQRTDALIAALRRLEVDGLGVLVDRGAESTLHPDTRRLALELTGADHPGIVHDVSHVLAERGINIEELNTQRISAPMAGQALFTAEARLECPREVDLEALESALEALADDLMVRIALHPADEE
jgi:glycine cleavage system regulatory protein